MYEKILNVVNNHNFSNNDEITTYFLKIHFQAIDFIANGFEIAFNNLVKRETPLIIWISTYYKLLQHIAVQSENKYLLNIITDTDFSKLNKKDIKQILNTATCLLEQTDIKQILFLSNYYYQTYEPSTTEFYLDLNFTNKIFNKIKNLKSSVLLEYILEAFHNENITTCFILIEKIYRLIKIPEKYFSLEISIRNILNNMFTDIKEDTIKDIFNMTKAYIKNSLQLS